MFKTSSETVYLSASANCHENNISCSDNYLLYSSSNAPVLYDLKSRKISHILIGHKGQVNGQQFVINASDHVDDVPYIFSTAYDKQAIIWKIIDKNRYELVYNFSSTDDNPFLSRCCVRTGDTFRSVTTTLAGVTCLWENDKLIDSIKTSYYGFDSKVFKIANIILIILAGSDNKVHIFQLSESKLIHLLDLEGHSDWVKSVDMLVLKNRQLEFLLAAASQDAYIRVWHMKLVNKELDSNQVRTVQSHPLLDQQLILTATLETVLYGHEGIVHGLCWFKKPTNETCLQLVSCSEDKTLILWNASIALEETKSRYEQGPASAGSWKESYRFGETGEMNLPFLSTCLSPDEQTIYAQSLHGAIHSWRYQDVGGWKVHESITGHFGPVTDLAWERTGAYLISSSLDKTCRLHSVCQIDNRWREIARPQVHGYEINCLGSLDFDKFASGSEEKTIRCYEITQFSLESFQALALQKAPHRVVDNLKHYPKQAQLPPLGLTIKASETPYDLEIGKTSANETGGQSSNTWCGVSKLAEELANLHHLENPPSEEILLQSTLWWEANKLFGHSNELHALAVDSTGSYLASASKANRSDLAAIIVWESKFRKAATIEHHGLTITRLRFSPNDQYLLSVSRDRTWCLSKRTGNPRPAFVKVTGTTKNNATHERIIWDCCWTFDSKYFLTVSRDKKAILWCLNHVITQHQSGDSDISCTSAVTFDNSIQAVDSLRQQISPNTYLFAFGLETGTLDLRLVSVEQEKVNWQSLISITHFHHLPLRRLAFKPQLEEKSQNQDNQQQNISFLLASGADDCMVKVTRFYLEEKP